jgi:tRNA (guanine37-N1)-methyltransferase
MQFDILTIFPNLFDPYFNISILKKAQEKKKIKINIHDLRKWTTDKHRTVDDKPYGGGPGMILKVEPIAKALKELKKKNKFKKEKIILLTPQGKQFDQKEALKISKYNRIILICGHYEGYDSRIKKLVDQEISIGPYVLTGGEIPAIIIVDAITRLVPGVIKKESLEDETFNSENQKEYPQYTRPEVFTHKDNSGRIKSLKVPKVLISGNHKKISEWKKNKVRSLNRKSIKGKRQK